MTQTTARVACSCVSSHLLLFTLLQAGKHVYGTVQEIDSEPRRVMLYTELGLKILRFVSGLQQQY